MKTIIASPKAPKAVGPYSQAVKCGDTLYISGQLPIDGATGAMPESIEDQIGDLLSTQDKEQTEPERIINVNHVLDELIEQSVALVGKPVALMNKDDKVRAIRFLNEAGAFLVTKSGDKVAKYFGISKYTLYSYIDANKDGDK